MIKVPSVGVSSLQYFFSILWRYLLKDLYATNYNTEVMDKNISLKYLITFLTHYLLKVLVLVHGTNYKGPGLKFSES